MRYLRAMVVVAGLCAAPVWAAETSEQPQASAAQAQQPAGTEEMVKLTDAELDEVFASGRRSSRFNFSNNFSNNVTILNIALVFQINIGGTAVQTATVTAIQQILPGLLTLP